MPNIVLGWPEWKPKEGKSGVLSIPPKDLGDVIDIGDSTAHEIGHFVMQGRQEPAQGKKHVEQEVEAWVWQVSKRGFTKDSREYFWDEIASDAQEHGVSRDELADMVTRSLAKIEGMKGVK